MLAPDAYTAEADINAADNAIAAKEDDGDVEMGE